MKWRAIEVRLLAFYCLLLVSLGGIFAVFTVQSFSHFEAESIRRGIIVRANEIWAVGGSSIDKPEQLKELIERRFSPGAQDRFVRISSNGRIIYQSADPRSRAFQTQSIDLPAEADSQLMREFGNLYVVSQQFEGPDGRRFIVQSGQSERFAEAIRSSLISTLLIGLPILLALAALGGHFLIQQAWGPLGLMIRAAEDITFNDPHNRLPLTGTGDRIDVLGQSLNRMLDRLDNAYQHISRFSADAAHELRTPIAIIRGEIEYIALHASLTPEFQKSAASILDESKRLADLLDNLLNLSQMESAWGKNAHAKVDIYALVTETIDQIGLMAEEKSICLNPPTGFSSIIFGDKNRLKQVIVNLIDNAIKYTPEGGRIDVECRPHNDRVELLVRDSGIGIAPEHQQDVFQRFYRISSDRGPSGAGLGLAIARSICQAHGGTLTVQSTPGKGSEFKVDLPIGGK